MIKQFFATFLIHQKIITISRMTMKMTTKTGKNQKISGKVQQESVETIKVIRFSQQT